MYGLSKEDLEIQARARGFVDGLIPYEVEAEMNDGELPDEVDAGVSSRKARELGLMATNMPKELGGGGCTMLQQVLVQEQVGRATNALAWMVSTPPSWFASCCDRVPARKMGDPSHSWRGSRVLRDHRGGRRYRRGRDRGDGTTRGGRVRARRGQVARHVLQRGDMGILPGEAHRAPATPVSMRCSSSTSRHPGCRWSGHRPTPTPSAHHHPILAFEGVRVPASNLVGEEGGGMAFAYEWFRFERFMVAARCLGAAERLVEEATAFAKVRVASGRPIIEHQLIQAMLADSLTELFAARSMLYAAAILVPTRSGHEGAARARVDGKALRVGDGQPRSGPSLQIFGGRGYMRENVAERFCRELRVERIWEGTSEIQRTIISEQLAKRGTATLV